MSIVTTIRNDFPHRLRCPTDNDRNCDTEMFQLDYRCTRCYHNCVKCTAFHLNASSPYVRGCQEARRALSNYSSCVCSLSQGCEH
jgi:hypothetical protein